MTGPEQIKIVLEDEPDACSFKLTTDIAVATQ
jgi:hypothetical protein